MAYSIIKILIVEDSPTTAELLIHIIQSDPLLKVIGCVNSGKKALDFIISNLPDVVIIDMTARPFNGFETTRQIMQTHPIPIIIFSSGFKKEDVNQSFQALNAGALDILAKPNGLQDPNFPTIASALITLVKTVSGMALVKRHYSSVQANLESIQEIKPPAKIEAVAIGSSLGGPKALYRIFSELPPNFPIPIFVVQHIFAGFTQGFVEWLQGSTSLKIKIAQDYETPVAGTIYIAPDHRHLEINQDYQIKLSDAPSNKGLRPSVSHLFRSMAKVYGPHAIGIILTGMGKDGADTLLAMKEAGAWTIAQDQQSCLVFGMPKEAIAIHAVQQVLPLNQIAHHLKLLV